MTTPAETGSPTALEIVEALKRDLEIESFRRPRYVYLGDAAHNAVLKALERIYPPGNLKRLTAPAAGDEPVRLITVAALKVRRHHLPHTILVTADEL